MHNVSQNNVRMLKIFSYIAFFSCPVLNSQFVSMESMDS